MTTAGVPRGERVRKQLGWCMAIRAGARCGAPAYRRWYDWLGCDWCIPDAQNRRGEFSASCSVLTEKGEREG